MARHRSPRGRGAHHGPLLVAPGYHGGTGRGAHRSAKTPLRRGAAVVAVTGGAFSLVGAASPPPDVTSVAQVRPADADQAGAPAASAPPPAQPAHVLDTTALVETVHRAEQAVARLTAEPAAQEEDEASTGAVDCGLDESDLGRVRSHVRKATEILGCRFGEPTVYGVAGRAGTSDHPSGKAVDFMVDRATGDALASCALENMDALGVKYVIWEQRINHGNGWKRMEDRGGATANHFDHVHVSFDSGAGDRSLRRC